MPGSFRIFVPHPCLPFASSPVFVYFPGWIFFEKITIFVPRVILVHIKVWLFHPPGREIRRIFLSLHRNCLFFYIALVMVSLTLPTAKPGGFSYGKRRNGPKIAL